MPHCCWGFLAVVGAPLQKITKQPKVQTMDQCPSGVKRKQIVNDLVTQDAEEVIRMMEDEEFSAWCNKNLSDDSLDEHEDEGDELQKEGGDVIDKISYL